MPGKKGLPPPETTNRKNLLHKEPSVIDEQMILASLDALLPSGEQGKYARLGGINSREATHLLLEFQNVSQIANLSHMTNLTKLQLCNNILTKIEKLDNLVNLVWLDLSFNSIKTIENLDKLVKLEYINFHRNLITQVENMDNQLRLEIFIISSNGIRSFDQIKYLRRFVRLQSVNFEDNPVTSDANYRIFTIALLPQISFLDYVRVTAAERQKADSLFKERLEKIAAADEKLRRRASVVEADEKVRETYALAFVNGFDEDEFWKEMYAQDADGKIVLMIGDTDDVQAMYHELFRRACKDLFDKGMLNYNMRQNEIEAYNMALKEEKDVVKLEGQKVTEQFYTVAKEAVHRQMRGWVNLIDDLERRLGSTDVEKYPEDSRLKCYEYQKNLNKNVLEYVGTIHDVWYVIMTAEMALHEQIVEVNQELDHSLQELVSNWLEQLRGHFGVLRDVQLQFNDRLVEDLVTYGNFRLSDTTIPESLHYLLQDKEALGALIQSSHENHNAFIDTKEETMVAALKTWLDNAVTDLARDEVLRNRMRISEISHFCDFHRRVLEDKHIISYVTCYVPELRKNQSLLPEQDEEEEVEETKSLDMTRMRISSTLLKLQKLSKSSPHLKKKSSNHLKKHSKAPLAHEGGGGGEEELGKGDGGTDVEDKKPSVIGSGDRKPSITEAASTTKLPEAKSSNAHVPIPKSVGSDIPLAEKKMSIMKTDKNSDRADKKSVSISTNVK